jgi:hypothetical protein
LLPLPLPPPLLRLLLPTLLMPAQLWFLPPQAPRRACLACRLPRR